MTFLVNLPNGTGILRRGVGTAIQRTSRDRGVAIAFASVRERIRRFRQPRTRLIVEI
jgi:hypothetical protein